METSKTIGNENFMKWLDQALNCTALFREYASRMIEEVNRLSLLIENRQDCPQDNILNRSSIILKEIFEEHEQCPDYVKELTLAGDYFDPLEMGVNAKAALEIGLKIEPELFSVNYKENLLVYKNPNYDIKKLQAISKELPVKWEAKTGIGSLSMNLEEARKHLPLENVVNIVGQRSSGIEQLIISLKVEPEQFTINEEEGLLVFKTENGDVTRLVEIQKELPKDWNAALTLNSLAVSLDKAKESLDISNVKTIKKQSWINRIFNRIK